MTKITKPLLDEILNLLQEESAEIIQIASKIRRWGMDSEWNGITNKDNLETEIGDLLCIVKILSDNGMIDVDHVEYYAKEKVNKLKVWAPNLADIL